jgi:hypothetical protein
MPAFLPLLAAAAWTDALVIATVALGAAVALTGIASFDARVRGRLPIAVLAHGNSAISVGLIVAGLTIVALALGLGES